MNKIYEYMYWDLMSNQLTVSLVPSTDPGRAANGCCARAVEERNPQWYSEFCDLFLDHRGKTFIKRQYILKVLKRLYEGKPCTSKYVGYLEDIAIEIKKTMDVSDEDMEFFIMYGEFPEPFEGQF